MKEVIRVPQHNGSDDRTRLWEDQTKSPRRRAEALVAAMSHEQKIAQLHGAMETIDIYELSRRAQEAGEDLDSLAEPRARPPRHYP
jgi:beta-glucosidase